jgi:hypothetical protein
MTELLLELQQIYLNASSDRYTKPMRLSFIRRAINELSV